MEITQYSRDNLAEKAACAGAVAKPLLALYELMGFEAEVLGPPRWVNGAERYVARTSVATIRSALEVLRRLT